MATNNNGDVIYIGIRSINANRLTNIKIIVVILPVIIHFIKKVLLFIYLLFYMFYKVLLSPELINYLGSFLKVCSSSTNKNRLLDFYDVN